MIDRIILMAIVFFVALGLFCCAADRAYLDDKAAWETEYLGGMTDGED